MDKNLPYEGIVEYGNIGRIAKNINITRVSDSSWLYSSTIDFWWSMGTYSSNSNAMSHSRFIVPDGKYVNMPSQMSYVIRPVITIKK